MKDLALLLGDPAFRRLGWALASFLWQGALVAAILFCVNALLSRRNSRARYAAGCAALVLMLLLPAVSYLGHREIAAPPTGAPGASPALAAEDSPSGFATRRAGAGDAHESGGIERTLRASAAWLAPWIVPAWLCGVLLLSARFLAGWNAARTLPLQGVSPAPAAVQAVLERLRARLGIDCRVNLLESVSVNVPTALGVVRPVILLPVCAVTGLSPEAIEAVLAHELAHIRWHDYLVNLLQTAAETLLFYHPAVWWVTRRIRIERENCCDDLAVAATGDSRGDVRALVVLEEIRAPRQAMPGPAVAADGGSLRRRIARLLPASSSPSLSLAEDAPRWLAGLLALAMIATVGAAAHTSLFEDLPLDPAVPAAPAVSPATGVSGVPAVAGAAVRTHRPPELSARAVRRAAPVSAVAGGVAGGIPGGIPGGVAGGIGGAVSGAIAEGVEGDGEDEETASAQTEGSLDPEDLANLRRHGVTPEFLRRFHEAGYPRISADDAVSLRIHGIDPEAAAEWATVTGRRPGLDEIVSARTHGATPEYAREMRSLGFDANLDTLVDLRIHGVTPDFVRNLRSLGYTGLAADEAAAASTASRSTSSRKSSHSDTPLLRSTS